MYNANRACCPANLLPGASFVLAPQLESVGMHGLQHERPQVNELITANAMLRICGWHHGELAAVLG